MPFWPDIDQLRVVANPEFLREGVAVKDFMEAALVVVGGNDPAAVRRVADSVPDRPGETMPGGPAHSRNDQVRLQRVSRGENRVRQRNRRARRSAGRQSGRSARDALQRRQTQTSAAYLKPGFAFGGSCLPKDLRALRYRAARLDLKLPMLESVLPGNEEHLRRAIQASLDLGPARIGVVGLAFKENTDDLRESPVVTMLEHLIGKGRDIRIYDPHIQMDRFTVRIAIIF